jgi:hypothetical protein
MLNAPFYGQHNLAVNGWRVRHSVHSILFYVSVLIVAVITTGSVVIFGLSALNRVEPASNTTVIFQRPDLPVISNRYAKGSKDANNSKVEKFP